MNRDKIILLGFMGCGKSTVGKSLAKILKWDFIDLDDLIEEKEKMKISKIFELSGEAHFRSVESYCLKSILANKKKQVIALGGGAPCYNNNMKLLKKFPSFYLKCGYKLLATRLSKERSHRPLIAGQSETSLNSYVRSTLQGRKKYYQKASFTILAYRTPVQISIRIKQLLKG